MQATVTTAVLVLTAVAGWNAGWFRSLEPPRDVVFAQPAETSSDVATEPAPGDPPSKDSQSPERPPSKDLPEGWTTTRIGVLTVDHPKDWEIRRVVEGDSPDPMVVLSNRPLTGPDIDRALFARKDVQFSSQFPTDAVVFVVGSDGFRAPPGPAGSLGEAVVLPRPRGFTGDVVARVGRIPYSILHLAGYFGPDAPPGAGEDAETVASRLRQGTLYVEHQSNPPSAEEAEYFGQGVNPGSPVFAEPWPLPVGLNLDDDERVNVRTQGDCVALTRENADGVNLFVETGRCDVPMPARAIELFTDLQVEPGSIAADVRHPTRHVVAARISRDVHNVVAEQIGGQDVTTDVGGGWVLALAKGRVFRLVAFDRDGNRLGAVTVR